MTYTELCDLLIEHSEREATNQTAFFRDCLWLRAAKMRTEPRPPRSDWQRVTVDTPIYFFHWMTFESRRCGRRMLNA